MTMADMQAAQQAQGERAQRIAAFRRSLGDIACLISQDDLRVRARDFYWYSEKRSRRLWSALRRPMTVLDRMGKNATIQAQISKAPIVLST
jgi:hypothetical protein